MSADNTTVASVLVVIWAAGYASTFLGFIAVVFDLDILQSRVVLRLILVLATTGAAVSVLGIMKLLGARMPAAIPFSGEVDLLSFAAYLNMFLYAVLFLWVVNKGFADLAERVADFVTGFKPISKARKAEQRKDYPRAIVFYQIHLETALDDFEAMRHYASCLVHAGRFREALAVLNEVAKHTRGLNALTAGVEVVYVLRHCLAEKAPAEKETDRLRKHYAGTPFERELEARLSGLASRNAR